MSSLNRVLLIGNLTRDPELRQTQKGSPVCDLGIAVNRAWTDENGEKHDEVTFVDVTAWGKTAQNAATYLSKGRGLLVEGRLQLDTWQDAESGQQRSKLRVVAERLQFLGGGEESGDREDRQRSGNRGETARQPRPQQPNRSPAPARAGNGSGGRQRKAA